MGFKRIEFYHKKADFRKKKHFVFIHKLWYDKHERK